MPASFTAAAKFWIGLLGAILIAASTALDNPPQWLGVVIAVLTAIGVYLVPNGSGTLPAPAGDAQDDEA